MRVKNIDPQQQEQLIDKLEQILLSEQKSITLYDLDQNKEVQEQIMSMVNEIKEAFHVHNFTGINRPDNMKRPWLSIVRTLLQKRYTIMIEDYRDKEKGVRTKRYHFQLKTT